MCVDYSLKRVERRKQNETKTKLVSSIVTLLICFAMLIGTTFAWFTDSVSSTGNKIQAGSMINVVVSLGAE